MNFTTEDYKPAFLGGPDIITDVPVAMLDRMHAVNILLEEIEGELKAKRWNNEAAYWRAIMRIRDAMNSVREAGLILEEGE
jgi:hypothetical protein